MCIDKYTIINNKILGPITHKFYYDLKNDFILGNFMFMFEADICDSILSYILLLSQVT